jgi:glycosyltransferase involved in cell wall biosynthesis
METLKICMIGKYPPHKGGSAGLNYWLARTLGELGHEIHVITDPLENGQNYLEGLGRDGMAGFEPKNVKVHCPVMDRPIPVKSKISMLVNSAIDVISENDIDAIDAKYFIPYGISGFFSKLLAGKPLVIRHGGSDVTYLLKSPIYGKLLLKMLGGADKILVDPAKSEEIERMGIPRNKIENASDFGMSVNNVSSAGSKKILKKIGIDDGFPILGVFGKISRGKGLPELFKGLSLIKDEDFHLLVVPEDEKDAVSNYASEFGLAEKTTIMDYQPPWIMPFLYDSLTALVATEVDFPVKMHTPLTGFESMYFGKCTIISEETHRKPQFANFRHQIDVIVTNPKDTSQYAKTLKWVIRNPDVAKKIGQNAKTRRPLDEGKANAQGLIEIYKKAINNYKKG